MKEKISPENETSNQTPNMIVPENASSQINGHPQSDLQISESDSHETGRCERKMTELSAASDLNYSLPSLLTLPLSKVSTEPLNSGISTTQVGPLSSSSQIVPIIDSKIPENGSPHDCFAPKNYYPMARISENFSEILEQPVQSAVHTNQNNNGLHCMPPHQLFYFNDVSSLNISGTKSKSENGKEPFKPQTSQESPEIATSPGEIFQGTLSGEKARKRKRGREDEPATKSAFQRKMEHLDKEKERRLRQTKCYELLRNLVPFCDMKTDKANVLEVTVAYLNFIKKTVGPRMTVIDKNFLEDLKRKTDYSN